MDVPPLLDHIVIAGPSLEELVDWFRDLTGVTAAPGGRHPVGTANALIALTVDGEKRPHYLELVGPDPEREGEELPKMFHIHRLKKPTLLTYAAHPENIDQVVERARENGVELGEVQSLSRTTPDGQELQWRLTQAKPPINYGLPFLIDWGSTDQPGLGDLPSLELVSFTRVEVKPEPLRKATAALGLDDRLAEIREGHGSRFVLVVRTEDRREIEV
ncbi:VOC family protein [Brachybacterium saurashtrense]|uniref:VOC family protein n=1 Tax=Brachybacterium saurashtrense TaxID=556288 RepID=A0A345YS42_9MICO|nr:VOC family protein [Brachybacterium saurashtrense]AXK46744.1 VOC family protein [Brachybacterium saurashtrense]RRR22459.1 VOC family protein [Brachybacterium saurashtrense]